MGFGRANLEARVKETMSKLYGLIADFERETLGRIEHLDGTPPFRSMFYRNFVWRNPASWCINAQNLNESTWQFSAQTLTLVD